MALLRAANTIWLNIVLAFLVGAMVVLLPVIDRAICKRLKVNLIHNLSENPKAEGLLRLRKLILVILFLLYLAANLYLVFFSRGESTDYSVHVAPLESLSSAIQVDGSMADLFSDIITEGFGAFSKVHVVRQADVGQAIANILLYVPMGYLLPYVFDWFRKNNRRAVLFCVLFSFLTENVQLMFRRGCYDFDDLVFNSIGGFLGAVLYRALAYYLTHPHWRREQLQESFYALKTRRAALPRFAREIACARVSLQASHETEIQEFYVKKLGFRLKGSHKADTGDGSSVLLKIGSLNVEFLCANNEEAVPPQSLVLSCSHLDRLSRRLKKKGIEPSAFSADIYSGRKSMDITGPDGVKIVFEEY